MPLRRHRTVLLPIVVFTGLLTILFGGSVQSGFAQNPPPPLNIFKNYIVTGDYVAAGWVEQSSSNGLATGTISIPDCKQAAALGQACPPPQPPVPRGADIVAAYLYWATVEGNQSIFVGQQAVFNGYKIIGSVLGNPKAPTSWSSGGCTGSSTGSKTMRMYRADVRPYLPRDLLDPSSPTFGALVPNAIAPDGNVAPISVQLADSGSNGNTQPNALGATLVIIYRVLSPATTPLNAIVLYDGSYAPSNGNPIMTNNIVGFYQPASLGRVAKLTQIVANGQPNKGENVYFGPTPLTIGSATFLPPLYPAYNTPFPGLYGGTWDNPTWTSGTAHGTKYDISALMDLSQTGLNSPSQTVYVAPASTNSGCVNWGAIILSTTVQDTDGDGLLDPWEDQLGYWDYVHLDTKQSPTWVALTGANKNAKDIFVEVDYLTNLDGTAGPVPHSHLPKQTALDNVGAAFANQNPIINLHFDLGANIYQGDPYVISNGTGGTGGNPIPEVSLLCTDPNPPAPPGTLCPFPNQPAVSWKGGFAGVQNNPAQGNFQPGRTQSYRYALFGHSLGTPRSYWGALANAFASKSLSLSAKTMPQLVSIVVCNNTSNCANPGTTTVTIESPSMIVSPSGNLVPPLVQPLTLKPGDCTPPAPAPTPQPCITDMNHANFSNAIWGRVTISGSLATYVIPPLTGQNQTNLPLPAPPPLNGTYAFTGANSTAPDPKNNSIVTTTFRITTLPAAQGGPSDGTYQYTCNPAQPTVPPCVAEPQLGVSYLGPTSSSGHSDFSGGGDLAVTLGLWGADDDPASCNPDPSTPNGQPLCDNQVGTLKVQTGTLMHELGHTLTLTHGGTYYNDPNNPSVPTYEVNCKPNFLSAMNYLFQVRGFVDGNVQNPAPPPFKFDYSGQELPPLNETFPNAVNGVPPLNESNGINSGQPAPHLTRWYSFPNAADLQLQDFAKAHCDGTPLSATEDPTTNPRVRVDGALQPDGTIPGPLDWNNDLSIDAISAVPAAANGVDVNFNGIPNDAPFSGFDDWQGSTNTGAVDLRQTNARASGFGFSEGGGVNIPGGGVNIPGGGTDPDGGGVNIPGGGVNIPGGGVNIPGGGIDEDTETANSTVDAPTNLNCQNPPSGSTVPKCTGSGTYLEKSKSVPLAWKSPDFGQIRSYTVWRAVGSFTTMQQIVANIGAFIQIPTTPTLTGAPPPTSAIDSFNLKSSTTYTYFVTDSNSFSAKSSASAPLVVTVKF